MARLVGLTGGIACGKSLVAEECRRHGLPVIDCDAIAKECATKVCHISFPVCYGSRHSRSVHVLALREFSPKCEIVFQGSWGWRRVRNAFKEYDVFQADGAHPIAHCTADRLNPVLEVTLCALPQGQ
jgi:hypothetical protein